MPSLFNKFAENFRKKKTTKFMLIIVKIKNKTIQNCHFKQIDQLSGVEILFL
jgi:hypothetical protein